MIIINSYLKRPQISKIDLRDVDVDPEKYFIEVENEKDILDFSKNQSLRYLEGAIIIKNYDEIIMGFNYYDLIIPLWAYFLNVLDDLTSQRVAYTYFPDQPTKIEVRVMDTNWVTLTINETKWVLQKNEFFNAILSSAEHFFKKMIAYFGDITNCYNELNRVNELKKKYSFS